MIPNWLLGKSKSKLQEILGGGGGGGTTYTAGEGIDITNHKISVDPLLMNDIEQTALAIPTKAAKTQITNPNILHNPWFTVNQRGVSSVMANGLYIADRWRSYSVTENYTMTRDSNGTVIIDATTNENNVSLIQRRTSTYGNSLSGMKLTMSVMFGDGTIYSGTKIYNPKSEIIYYNDDTIALASMYANAPLFEIRVKPGASVTIKALKLEVGEISTLHLDPRPEYAIELAKCQRYFQRIAGETRIAFGMASTSTTLQVQFTIASQMRTTPTISGSLKYGRASSSSIIGTIGINGLHESICDLLLNDSNATFTIGDMYSIYIPNGGYLDFNAEL